MWMFEKIISILSFPVHWFWQSYEDAKETRNFGKVIALFLISLTGLVLFVSAFIWISNWLLTYHADKVTIVGLVIWLYVYVKSKMNKNEDAYTYENEQQTLTLSHEQAQRGYPIIRNVMYQTLKGCAEKIGCIIPRMIQEIEVPESHYIISNDICFYQFKLAKKDTRLQYYREDMQEFERIVQNEISRKIQAGEFPSLGIQNYLSAYGDIFDAICIDLIEEVDMYLIIQASYYSPTYAEYWRNKQLYLQNDIVDTTIPDEEWKNKP